MVKRLGGKARKSRKTLRKSVWQRGKISLARYFAAFKTGEKVCLVAEPAIQSGAHLPRFQGLSGYVKERIGRCYKVVINDGGKEKMVIVHPVHMRRLK
ncbi:MAG: 50S ribosomal protein L21e [Candidatus Woesearchaeota archaeon]